MQKTAKRYTIIHSTLWEVWLLLSFQTLLPFCKTKRKLKWQKKKKKKKVHFFVLDKEWDCDITKVLGFGIVVAGLWLLPWKE